MMGIRWHQCKIVHTIACRFEQQQIDWFLYVTITDIQLRWARLKMANRERATRLDNLHNDVNAIYFAMKMHESSSWECHRYVVVSCGHRNVKEIEYDKIINDTNEYINVIWSLRISRSYSTRIGQKRIEMMHCVKVANNSTCLHRNNGQ